MTARILSVNVGRAAAVPGLDEPSAIDKGPVGSVQVRAPGPKRGGRGSGVVGDDVVSRRHHGGDRQAVYAVAVEELRWWGRELGRDLVPGTFGENLTTEGLDVDAAVVGERWRVGGVVELEVCGPRVPCATFAAHMGEARWVRRFTERGRTGAYLAVVVPGEIRAGDPVSVLSRPEHGVDVPTVFRGLTGDLVAAARVLEAGALDEDDAAALARKVERSRHRR